MVYCIRYGFYVQYTDTSYGYGCTLSSILLGYLFGHVTGLLAISITVRRKSRPVLVWFQLHGTVPTLWCWLFLGTVSISYDTGMVLLCSSQHTPAAQDFDIQFLKGWLIVCFV